MVAIQDESYLNSVKKAGTPPVDVWKAMPNQEWFGLFRSFVDSLGKTELSAFAQAVDLIQFAQKDADTVWSSVEAPWAHDTLLVKRDHDEAPIPEALKSEMLNDATSNLEEIYTSEFLPYVSDILEGGFDGDDESDLELEDSIESLINQLTEVVSKNSVPVSNLIEKVKPEDFGTSASELENILNEFNSFAGSGKINDRKAKAELRKSISLDEGELSKLLEELTSEPDTTLPSSDELQNLIDQLVNFTEAEPDEKILSMLDIDEFQASDDDLEKLLLEIEQYAKATDKGAAINQLRSSVTINESDLDKLIHDLSSGTATTNWTDEWDQKLDTLLNELVQDAPRPDERVNLLSNVAPKSLRLSGSELDTVLENLAKLADNHEQKPLRRRLSRNISSDEIDQLINELQNFDFGAQDKPAALLASDWDLDWVAELNYRNIKAADGGTIPVVCCGQYVLIGDEWNDTTDPTLQMYRNGLTRAYEGEQGYPASQGLIETGQVKIQKAPSIFNPGKLEFSGITSGRSRQGIEASVQAKSKKKVVFLD